MRFPEKLSRLCWQRGWSQRELAEALGDVSKSTVSNWMTGKTDPRLGELARLARLFGVSADYLVLDERDEPGGDGLGEVQRRVLWAAGTVGYELALKRIMNAPSDEAGCLANRDSLPPAKPIGDTAVAPGQGRAQRACSAGRGARKKRASGGPKR